MVLNTIKQVQIDDWQKSIGFKGKAILYKDDSYNPDFIHGGNTFL